MNAFWDQAVEVLKQAILAYAYVFNGNLGAGILAVTFLARLALMPVTLRLARIAATHQKVMQKLQPELDGIKRRWANDAIRINEEIRKVFAREGISPVPVVGCVGMLAQAPVLLALYSAVRNVAVMGGRFAWIRDISQPSIILTAVVAALTACSMMVSGDTSTQNRALMVLLPTIITMIVLSKVAAGIAIYWGMSSAFSVAQGVIAKRHTA